MIALPETNGKGAQTFIKRIKYAIENPIIDDVKMILKLSIGQAIYPRDGDDIDELIKISDNRMYMKKQNNPKYP